MKIIMPLFVLIFLFIVLLLQTESLTSVMIGIIISPLIFIIIRYQSKKIEKFDQLIKKKLIKNNFNYSTDFKKENIVHYNNFKTIKNFRINHFSITGNYLNNGFNYFQINNFFKKYSVLLISLDYYNPKFDHIHITPQTILKITQDYDLEWIDFNKSFTNNLKNPKQALEILTPTFMETLMYLKKEYGSIDIECFEEKNYQTNTIAILKRGHIFPVILHKENEIEKYINNFIFFLNGAIKLKNNI